MDTHPQLSKANLAQVAALVRDEAGIALTEAKAPLVHSRLSRRLTALGLNDFSSYFDFVNGPKGAEERRKMLSALTTNVTRFFREPHHFEQMAQDTLPPLLDRARQGGRVRIWSAGCSSGEEPYSIAATILSLEPDAARMDIRILASDIDPEILAKARRGVYANDALGATPVKNVERFFDVTADGLSAGAAIRELISFRELNLVREWPMKGRFDIIFCRNVIIYFDQDVQAGLMSRFGGILSTGGALFIGHSERVSGPDTGRFERYGLTSYRLVN